MAVETKILTTKQVAERFAVHPSTVVGWANAGYLQSFRTPGGHRRFRVEDVEALLNTNQPAA